MNRYQFTRPREHWGPEFICKLITDNPRLSSTQLTKLMNIEYGMNRNVPEVHGLIHVLRKKGKIKATEGAGPRGGMVYESI